MATDSPDRAHDHAGLIVLTLAESLERLRWGWLGRIGFVQAGVVEILPVNYVVSGSSVAFRTGWGAKLGAAMDGAPVTFEVDGVAAHLEPRNAWSVVIKGKAGLVTDDDVLERLEAEMIRPLLPSASRTGRWVLIRAEEISGRAVPFFADAPTTD